MVGETDFASYAITTKAAAAQKVDGITIPAKRSKRGKGDAMKAQIKGYEGLYSVDTNGVVYAKK